MVLDHRALLLLAMPGALAQFPGMPGMPTEARPIVDPSVWALP